MNQLRLFLICLTLWSSRAEEKSKCPGPLAFYESLECTPIAKTIVNGCAYQYNCDRVKSLQWDKCHVNNRTYEVGERLKDEDANPCDIGCTCVKNWNYDKVSAFNCVVVDCFQPPPKEGCYRKNSPLDCCPGEEVCPENPEDRAICNVDGKEYKDGEYFLVEGEPDLSCICQPLYEGKNVEPFCVKSKHAYCSPLFRHPEIIKDNCVPVYYSNQSPQTDCFTFVRCQNERDRVIKAKTKDTKKSATVCHFGSLVMRYGDELNKNTDYSSVCVKCVCEVGPTLTCQKLPESECDVNHNTNLLENLLSATNGILKLANSIV